MFSIARQILSHALLRKACLASLALHLCGLVLLAGWSIQAAQRQVARLGSENGVVVFKAEWAEVEPTPVMATVRMPRETVLIQPHRAQVARQLYLDIQGDQVPLEELLASEVFESARQQTEPVEHEMQLVRAEVNLPVTTQEANDAVRPVDRTTRTRPPQPKLTARPASASSGVRTGPNFAGNRPPRYPDQARQHGWEGQVMLRIFISAEGKVSQVQVVRSSGHELLDAAAVRAVSTWSGTPATLDGRPVETEELLPIRFKLR